MNLPSYSSIFNLGHRAIGGLLDGPVLCEEKLDGSQFSFGLLDGELQFKSKGAVIQPDEPPKMFAAGVDYIKSIKDKLVPGYVYRGEYFSKPKHNCLAYDRIPDNHIAIFDIDRDGNGNYLSPEDKQIAAKAIGLDVVPQLFVGKIESLEQFQELIKATSYLGGQQIEGVVVKPLNYDIFGTDKKVLMGKYVREEFRELNHKNFRSENPKQGDMVVRLGQELRTEARWLKAIQHLRDAGQLEDSPKDISKLFKEVPLDLTKECADDIKDKLFAWAWPQITRIATNGLAEFYKEYLLKQQFGPESVEGRIAEYASHVG